jgi:hypothetical protein
MGPKKVNLFIKEDVYYRRDTKRMVEAGDAGQPIGHLNLRSKSITNFAIVELMKTVSKKMILKKNS